MRAATVRSLLVSALGLVALAACGGSSGGAYRQPAGAPVAMLRVKSGNLYFDPTKLTAPAGIVAIKLTNVESGSHDLRIKGIPGFALPVSGEGSSKQEKVKLTKGTYHYYCSIPGHEQMQGTITVR